MPYGEKDLSYFEETCVASHPIFDGKVLHVFKDDVALSNGQRSTREYIRHVGAVCVLPLTENGEVICVRQYRYPTGMVMLEIPAGKLDYKGEDHESAVRRELREETGAICERLTDLGCFYSSPALMDERIRMYLAEGLTFGDTDPDEDEFVESVRIPLSELVNMVMRGEIPDIKTQAAVMRVAYLLEHREK